MDNTLPPLSKYGSRLPVEGSDKILKKMFVWSVGGFLTLNILYIVFYTPSIALPVSITSYFAEHIPAISRPIAHLHGLDSIQHDDRLLTRISTIRDIYGFCWFTLTFFAFPCFLWWLYLLTKMFRANYPYRFPKKFRWSRRKTLFATIVVMTLCGSVSAYCFYEEIYKGNYDFSYYNKGRNNVHRRNSDFFRYNVFFASSGLFSLAIVTYVVPVFFLVLTSDKKSLKL
jgi:hypothetical protein